MWALRQPARRARPPMTMQAKISFIADEATPSVAAFVRRPRARRRRCGPQLAHEAEARPALAQPLVVDASLDRLDSLEGAAELARCCAVGGRLPEGCDEHRMQPPRDERGGDGARAQRARPPRVASRGRGARGSTATSTSCRAACGPPLAKRPRRATCSSMDCRPPTSCASLPASSAISGSCARSCRPRCTPSGGSRATLAATSARAGRFATRAFARASAHTPPFPQLGGGRCRRAARASTTTATTRVLDEIVSGLSRGGHPDISAFLLASHRGALGASVFQSGGAFRAAAAARGL